MTTTTARRFSFIDAMSVTVPEGKSGDVEVRRFTVSEADSKRTRLQAMMRGRGFVEPGQYTALYRRGGLWMSDVRDERHDHLGFVYAVDRMNARTVLVNGLGLGMVAAVLRHVESVEHVTVCDIDPDVIALVGPHLRELYADAGKYIDIVQGDAYEPGKLYPKGSRWHAAWHDIFQDISGDDYEDHKRMRRKYARRTDLQDVWCADEVKRAAKPSGPYYGW